MYWFILSFIVRRHLSLELLVFTSRCECVADGNTSADNTVIHVCLSECGVRKVVPVLVFWLHGPGAGAVLVP